MQYSQKIRKMFANKNDHCVKLFTISYIFGFLNYFLDVIETIIGKFIKTKENSHGSLCSVFTLHVIMQ